MRSISPNPGIGGPNPLFDTYNALSGPSVIPVGKNNESAIICFLPDGSTSITLPVFGSGPPSTAEVSNTNILSLSSTAIPKIEENPVAHIFECPLGVTLYTFELPATTGNSPKLPT